MAEGKPLLSNILREAERSIARAGDIVRTQFSYKPRLGRLDRGTQQGPGLRTVTIHTALDLLPLFPVVAPDY